MGRQIHAALLSAPDAPFEMCSAELADPRPDEVVVRIAACGVCHTDAEARTLVPTPSVLGHEGAGIVELVGSEVRGFRAGDRVVMSYPSCGRCERCSKGRPFHCESGIDLSFGGHRADGSMPITLDGNPLASAFFQQSAFADYALVPSRSLVRIHDDIDAPWSILAALPCGILTGAGAVLEAFGVGPADSIAVFGAGAVGLAAVMAASMVGVSHIIAVDVAADRLALALELGAHQTLDANEGSVAARIREATPSGVRYALDTAGRGDTWRDAVESLGIGGQFGIVTEIPAFPFRPEELFLKAGSLRSILLGEAVPSVLIPKLLEWRAAGRFPVDRLVTAFPFERINDAFASSAAGQAIKPVLEMPGTTTFRNHPQETPS